MKLLILAALLFSTLAASALDSIEATKGGTSMSMTGSSSATDFQFGVTVNGTLRQRIDQLQRELRLLQFARDSFPSLFTNITYSGTNIQMSRCLFALSKQIGAPIPMDLGTNDFIAKEFVFEDIHLEDALKYLAAFDDSILDVSGRKLVLRPVSQALAMDQTQYHVFDLMIHQRYAAVEKILAGKPIDVQPIVDPDGETLLHFAARDGRAKIIRQLLALGADINAQDDADDTPLFQAVRFGHLKCASLLIEHGANVNIPDTDNDTPLETAVYFGYPDIAKTLVRHGAALDIFTASALGMTNLVQKYLDHRANPNDGRPSYYGERFGACCVTPLFWAARCGRVETARLLLSRGASVSARDGSGDTPLSWAADAGQLETVRFLVAHGADVNATNNGGSTPLLEAARDTVSPDVVRFLLQAGANVNARDNQGENALHKLAWFGYPAKNVETARILLADGADIRATNNAGQTPLDVLLANEMANRKLVEFYRTRTR